MVTKPTTGENVGYGAGGASLRRRVFKGMTAKSFSAREDIDLNNATTRQRSRVLFMSAPIARSAININRTNIVGQGLKLKSRVDADILGITREEASLWEKKTEREFALWSENKNNCDATGVNDFNGMQQLALISWLLNGDCPVPIKHFETTTMKPYGLRLHIIESDRLSTPAKNRCNSIFMNQIEGETEAGNKIFDGIEVDKSGKIIAFHICDEYPNSGVYSSSAKWTRIEAYGKKTELPNMLYVMNSERPEQYRGVSILAPVIEAILQIKRFTESELTAAVVSSFLTIFIETSQPANMNPLNETDPDDQVSSSSNDYEMGPGMINILEPGEKITVAESSRPNQSFDGFIKAIAMQIGAALEIPKDLLLKEFNKSYSASRAALLEAWKSFKMRREWFASDFCKPVYELFLSEAIARGRIQANGFFTDPMLKKAWLGCEWIGPSQGQLDPVKEVTAHLIAVQNGWETNDQATAQMSGGNWETNMDQLETENKRMKDVFGTLSGGVAVSVNIKEEKEEENTEND